eukprot:s649_g11.t1
MAAMSLCVVPLVGAVDAQLGFWTGCKESPLPLHLQKASRLSHSFATLRFELHDGDQGSDEPHGRGVNGTGLPAPVVGKCCSSTAFHVNQPLVYLEWQLKKPS